MKKRQDEWDSSEWAEYYDKLEQKNYMYYQESGENRYDRACYKYSKIAEAFRAKAREESEKDDGFKRRMNNRKYVGDRMSPEKKTYTAEEVRKLLDDAVWW